jgi:hypothetical protein
VADIFNVGLGFDPGPADVIVIPPSSPILAFYGAVFLAVLLLHKFSTTALAGNCLARLENLDPTLHAGIITEFSRPSSLKLGEWLSAMITILRNWQHTASDFIMVFVAGPAAEFTLPAEERRVTVQTNQCHHH